MMLHTVLRESQYCIAIFIVHSDENLILHQSWKEIQTQVQSLWVIKPDDDHTVSEALTGYETALTPQECQIILIYRRFFPYERARQRTMQQRGTDGYNAEHKRVIWSGNSDDYLKKKFLASSRFRNLRREGPGVSREE